MRRWAGGLFSPQAINARLTAAASKTVLFMRFVEARVRHAAFGLGRGSTVLPPGQNFYLDPNTVVISLKLTPSAGRAMASRSFSLPCK